VRQALRPPIAVRQVISASASANSSAPRRSSRSLVRSDAREVKKSTMMLPRRSWHQGRNNATAAPAAAAESSKSPTIVVPIVLRPSRLTQVISVITVNSRPAAIAHSLARDSISLMSGRGASGRQRVRYRVDGNWTTIPCNPARA
jgi:hypothetical protein